VTLGDQHRKVAKKQANGKQAATLARSSHVH
jgi:hypothetical protein